jgi:molybdenum cofactor cytidylyltransferase
MIPHGFDDGLLRAPGDGPEPRVRLGAVLLAGGAGSRLGGRPKSLLEFGGVSLVRRQLMALSGAGVQEVVVVLGHHAAAIAAAVCDFPVALACNPAPERGQVSSLLTGLAALSGKPDAVIVALADQPMIDAQDVLALIGAFAHRGDAAMVVPRVAGAPGNPVIFEAALGKEWLADGTGAAGRRWREMHPERVHWFDTDNAHYRIDIDTPQDLVRFGQRTGQALSWPATPTGGEGAVERRANPE